MTDDQKPRARPTLAIEDYLRLKGLEVGVSDWLAIDQRRIDAFADITMDWQPIHVDPVSAASSPFGTTIAHGFLTLSLLSALGSTLLPCIAGTSVRVNYGLDRVRFVHPVAVGQHIRGRFTLADVTQRSSGEYLSIVDVVVDIEHCDQPALIARWLTFARS